MDAVIFDLDGVLVDSETLWDEIRRSVVAEHGGEWTDEATRAMQGMSTPEWARYLVDTLGTELSAEEAAETVIARMGQRYEADPPILPGAAETARTVAERYRCAIASSSPPVLINAFLTATDLTGLIPTTVSSEQVDSGKPDPAVYLEAASRLGAAPEKCVAIEDSTNGLRAALAADMTVIGMPNPDFPPDSAVLARASTILNRITELPDALEQLQHSRFGS